MGGAGEPLGSVCGRIFSSPRRPYRVGMEFVRAWWVAVSAWLVPLAILAIGVVDIAQNGSLSSEGAQASFPGPIAVNLVFLVLVTVPLYWRFRAPVIVLITVTSVAAVWSSAMFTPSQQPPIEPALAIIVALFVLASSTQGRRLWVGTAYAGVVIVSLEAVGFVAGQGAGNVFPALLLFAVTWVIGQLVQRQRSSARGERDRADRLEQEQADRLREAAAAERARIARELHDVVAHSLSVIVVQAAAERRALGPDQDATNQVLGSIEVTGRQAMIELRRMLGLLRKTPDDVILSPQPGLSDLPGLVAEVEAAGIDVEVGQQGDLAHLPPGLDLSAYRIIQEALTNVLKHSRAHHVHVEVRADPRRLNIEVADDGTAQDESSLPGFGLVGMRERAAVYGGTVEAGPNPRSPGFRVHVTLPVEAGELARS